MKVLVCGSRFAIEASYIRGLLSDLDDHLRESTLIVGDATGADVIAEEFWRRHDWPVKIFEADWDRFGKSAGPRRNAEMVAQQPDLVLAFPLADAESAGTWDTIRRAVAAGIEVRIYPVRP